MSLSVSDDCLPDGGTWDAGTVTDPPALVGWPEEARTAAPAGLLGAALAAAGSAHAATQAITTGR
ncbi:MAG: hypothetical protein ACYDA6_07655 [Solirubrobacteraceae bacterium]